MTLSCEASKASRLKFAYGRAKSSQQWLLVKTGKPELVSAETKSSSNPVPYVGTNLKASVKASAPLVLTSMLHAKLRILSLLRLSITESMHAHAMLIFLLAKLRYCMALSQRKPLLRLNTIKVLHHLVVLSVAKH